MLIYRLILDITTYSSLVLGVFVLLQGRRAKINQVFFVFSLTVSIYTYFLKAGGFASSPEMALYFSRFMYIGVILIPPVYYHLTMRLLGWDSKLIYAFYAISAFFMAFLPTGYFISGTRYFIEFKIYSLRPGILYVPFLFYFFSTAGFALWLAYQQYRRSHGLRKRQLGYFVYGSIIGFIGGSIDYLPKFGLFIHPLNTYCNVLIAVYIGFFAYAIIKYRLMDIRVIVQKGLIYSTLIAIFTGLYLFVIYALGQLLGLRVGYNPLLIGGVVIFIFAFAFQPLKTRVQELIDRAFNKSRYNYRNMLKHLSQSAVSVIKLDSLLELIGGSVTDSMKLDGASIMILNKSRNEFETRYSRHEGVKENVNRDQAR